MGVIIVISLLIPLVQCQRACPPLIGDPSPPGCNKTFIQDVNGEFPCETNDDCPMGDNLPVDGQCIETYALCLEKK